MAKFDELGRSEFLGLFGFGKSTRYTIRYMGRSYDSKAILGVASGMTAREFSAGAAHTVRVLTRLGFTVRDGTPSAVPAEIRELVAAELGAYPFKEWTAGKVDPAAYFASGCNTAANISAFAAIGHDVGVAYPELRKAGIEALEAVAGSDVQVFVDSGAFSEVEFNAPHKCSAKSSKCKSSKCLGAGNFPHPTEERFSFVTVKPLSDDYFAELVGTYRRLAVALDRQVHVVAPDKVGDQVETLRRLSVFAEELRELETLGARVLVPVQKGELSQADFWQACLDVLGAGNWIPALPCKKAATTRDEAVAFAAAVKPRAIHLLGLGARNRSAAKFFDGIAAASPGVLIQCDSCLLAAHCNSDRRYGVARGIGKALEAKRFVDGIAARTMFQVAMAFGAVANF